ncbi:cytochrome C biogenesis protein [Campylobacter sp. LR291e]|uniref:cytochrome c biogenesis protein CcsA n=1 Tax=Campylobacter sp. LR291e TaxID=2593546 RepID=UPI00123AFB88|nr:cytochrome c biogenesis protein CcsA [Campylobacter sp. LR291e]KAA6230774.1 cytochrome C biogenesis protein [Campylobacter sp. LR291e]
MKVFIKNVGNIKISIMLFLLFAIFSALATFIESAYKTQTAWAMIYGTWWFGLIQLLLGINLACAIFSYKMINRKKIPLLLFHISFLFILFGAAMTRYLGFEGMVHIREGDTNSAIESSKSFVRLSTIKDGDIISVTNSDYISLLPFVNSFNLNLDLEKGKAKLVYENLLLDANSVFKENEKSPPLLVLTLSSEDSKGVDLYFRQGEIKTIDGINFAFLNDEVEKPFVKIDENLKLSSSNALSFLQMSSGDSASINPFDMVDSKERRLYTINNINFVVKFASLHGQESLIGKNRPQDESWWLWFKSAWLEVFRTMLVSSFGEPSNWKAFFLTPFKEFAMSTDYHSLELSGQNALKLRLSYDGEERELYIFEHSNPLRIELGGQRFFVSWRSEYYDLPFELYLKDFIMDRYPGSMSPSSYASEVEVRNDKENFDYRIFMNNVLDYDGYRFYQSSYDQDEMGTYLSVNKDPGKIPTYIGYFLLSLGMFLNLLNPHSRFRTLARLINKDALKTASIAIFILFIFNTKSLANSDFILNVDEKHAKNLASLVMQKATDGRMAPLDTLSKEILGKIYKKSTYKGKSANAIVLSMLTNVDEWQKEDIIIMPKNKAVRDEIARILNIESKPYISYLDFLSEDRQEYKLQKYVENANRKNPNARGIFDKELLYLDERANIMYLVFSGELFHFIPIANSQDNAWLTPFSAISHLKGEEREFVLSLIQNYFGAVTEAFANNDWKKADRGLNLLKEYQEKVGAAIIPSKTRLQTEIFVNHAEIFVKLTPLYLVAGFLLLCIVLAKMIKPNLKINLIFKLVYYFNIFAFLVHSIGLILRAYLADHAPWSNSYESMVYIAWALSLSGIFFSKKSPIALSLTSILAGITLLVAHLNEINPQITNLQPVLNSYWLSIHVSVITASYGFLGLCALLGIFVLILMCFLRKDDKFNANILRNITEATRINEMAMILGLCLLTIGNFLGAIWANESWGRYWSWDSKETWALISILVYAAILHIRMIPSWATQFNFAITSMFAYWVIIMTYFGVNYFLTGMHSYAGGEAAQIPDYVYWGFFLMVCLGIFSYTKRTYVGRL